MEALKADVRVLPFNILEKPEEAKETSLTYAANDMEKVKKAWKRIDQLGPEKISEILRERGMGSRQTWILFRRPRAGTGRAADEASAVRRMPAYLNP